MEVATQQVTALGPCAILQWQTTRRSYMVDNECFGAQFAPEPEVFERAFWEILDGTTIEDVVLSDLLNDALALRTNGDPRSMEKAFKKRLSDAEWSWPWFDEWRDRFVQSNTWPPMWSDYEQTWRSLSGVAPVNFRDAYWQIDFDHIRNWLRSTNHQPVPMPKSRASLLEYMERFVPWDAFQPFVQSWFAENRETDDDERQWLSRVLDEERPSLLRHSFFGRVASLRNCRDWDATAGRYRIKVFFDDGDAIRSMVAGRIAALESGDLAHLPPFYPGCRATLSLAPTPMR